MVIIVSYVQAHFRHLTAAAYAGELANQMMMNARVKTRRAKLTAPQQCLGVFTMIMSSSLAALF